MTPAALSAAARRLAEPSDRELIGRYAATRDGEAFAAVVRRHGRGVLAAARQVLADPAAVDDVFQATFVVLLRRAGGVRWAESAGGWLYATAHRLAVRARADARRRAAREARAARPERTDAPDPGWREAVAVLHEELDRLPDRHRLPLLLCYLDGQSRDEAAVALGWTPGMVKGCLERGRRVLADRLTRRGIALSAGLFGAMATAAGGPSAELVRQTLTAAGGGASPAVAALVRGAMPMTGVKWTLAGLTAAGLVVGGLTLAHPGVDTPGSPGSVAEVAPAPRPAEPKPKTVRVAGRVLGPDGKPVAGAKLFVIGWAAVTVSPQPAAGPDGRFALDLPDTRAAHLVARAPGLGTDWAYLGDGPTTDLVLTLPDDQPIAGRVVDDAGQPVAGVRVRVRQVYRPHTPGAFDKWLTAKGWGDAEVHQHGTLIRDDSGELTAAGGFPSATTDRDGRFALRGLGRDRVAGLRLTAPAVELQEPCVVTRPMAAFDGAGLWTIGRVAYHGAEPTLVVKPAPVVSGRVTDAATGKPVAGATLQTDYLTLMIDDQSGTSVPGEKVVTDADGRYALPGLPAGGLPRLHLVPPAADPYHRVSRFLTPEERGRQDFALVRGIWATVKVVDRRTGRPAPAQLYYGVFPDDHPAAAAVPGLWHDHTVPDPGTRWFARRPEYRVVVFPGKGMLAAGLNEGGFLTGVGVEAFEAHRQGDEIVGMAGISNLHWRQWGAFREIDVPADAKEFAVTIALDPGESAAVRLVDEGGNPVAGAVAVGLLRTVTSPPYWSPEPAAGADFTAVALRPGEVRRLQFVHKERKLAGTVLAVGGAADPVEVRMVKWAEVKGRLVDDKGKPVTDGGVMVQGRRDWDADLSAGTTPFSGDRSSHVGADGRFTLRGLVPGLTYTLRGWGAGDGATLPEVIPRAGETVDLGDVALPAAKN